MMTRSKNNSNISNDTSTHTEKAHQPINADTNTDTGATTDTPRAREKVLLFFPGDIQNTREQMQKLQLALPLPIDAPFIDKFCLESVTEGLARKFPECDRVVTVPASNVFDGFSVYSNFLAVHPQFGGVSTYFPQSCTAQLVSLLLNAGIVSVKEGQRNDGDGGGARSSSSGSSSNSDSNSSNNGIDAREPNVNNSKETKSNKPKKVYTNQLASVYEGAAELKFPELVLVGFSKGVIVLNQLLAELSAVNGRHLALSKRVFNHVTELYYLDGGNGAPTVRFAVCMHQCYESLKLLFVCYDSYHLIYFDELIYYLELSSI